MLIVSLDMTFKCDIDLPIHFKYYELDRGNSKSPKGK